MTNIRELADKVLDAKDPAAELKSVVERGCELEDERLVDELQRLDNRLLACVYPYIASCIDMLCLRNVSEEEFYRQMWELMPRSSNMEAEETACILLGAMLRHPSVPYEHFDAVTMDDAEYSNRQEALAGAIDRIGCLLDRKFAQKTEQASALLQVLDSAEDERDRAVLMALLLQAAKTAGAEAADED